MAWHVLTDGHEFWGQRWELFNNSPCRPRSAMGGLQDATLCHGPAAIELETRRAWEVMRVEVRPVAVKFVRDDKEKETRVEVIP